MGQPTTGPGSQPWTGQHTPQGTPTHPGPPRRSRTGLWIALGCAALVVILLFLAVTGGVVYLATRGGSAGEEETPTAQTETFTSENFTFEYPQGWFVDETDPGEAGVVVTVASEEIPPDEYDEFAPQSFTVYLFDSDLHAQMECQQQAPFLGFGWDEPGTAEEIDPVALGGEELTAHRVTGTEDEQDAVSETYCADVDDQVLQVVWETIGSTEISPELQAVLDSWQWVEAG